MNPPKLDRLSALLEGLAPQVSLQSFDGSRLQAPKITQVPTLLVYFLTSGHAMWQAGGQAESVKGPVLVTVDARQPHLLEGAAEGACPVVVAQVRLTGPVAYLLLEAFASARTVGLTDDEPALRLALAVIQSELDTPRCGQPALLERAGDILFIGLLRHLVAQPDGQGRGLLSGLADPRIAKALVAMHQRPAFAWDLTLLAHEAGMSRTAFASRFHAVMQRPPGKYLSCIRLAMARRAVEQGKGLKEAARLTGYESSAALSRALSRSRANDRD